MPAATLDETKRVRYQRLIGQLSLERSQIWGDWFDLNDFILPTRGRFFLGQAERNRSRSRRSNKIIDSSASLAVRTLSSGMMSGVTSPARPWFRLTTPDPDLADNSAVKQWLHQTTQRMQNVFIRSNLYNKLPLMYQDLGTFGTHAMFVEEDDEKTVRFYDFPIGSYYLANDEKQRVRVFAREFQMTVRQLVRKFGRVPGSRDIDWGKFSPQVKTHWELGRPEAYIDIVHVVEPNEDYDDGKIDSKYKRFSSCYFERGYTGSTPNVTEVFLEEKGFDEFPVLAPRWEVTGEDVYATSCPGMIAIGDIKSLQTMKKRGLQAIDKKVTPPMIASTSMRTSKLTLLPGDVGYVDETRDQKFRPAHETNLDLGDLREEQSEIRNLIRRAFFEDLFLMLTYADQQQGAQPVTAREIAERHEEKLLALGPVLEQLNQDVLDPLIDRTFNIMLRRGEIPPAPPELEGVELKVEYISIMAQAQKAVGRAGIQDFTGFVINAAVETQNPEIMDKVDMDRVVEEYAEVTGVPPRFVVSDDVVQAKRNARAQATQQRAAAENAATAATAANKLAGADTSGKNALTDILGNLGGSSPLGSAAQ